MIADQQPRDRHRHRAADMELTRQGVAAHHDRQADQHLDIILVDRPHRAKRDPAGHEAEQRRRRPLRPGTAPARARSENGSPLTAVARMIENTTTPTPSLNRLSPATVACSVGSTVARFRTPITATGSVGLINAPNTRHQTSWQIEPERVGQRIEAAADDRRSRSARRSCSARGSASARGACRSSRRAARPRTAGTTASRPSTLPGSRCR
ncbi:MAG: hypothetical protein WKG07_20965 [Hymenobacter sp.]